MLYDQVKQKDKKEEVDAGALGFYFLFLFSNYSLQQVWVCIIVTQVCRGTAVMLVSPTDGTDEIANPFSQPDGA